ncbi:hypothetical protein [Bacillus nakamurai]|uniref:hypothetical protein n=1 Tax=Bacillus nakamurai TaxID=1793963 RepID=UPI001E41546C|nr:hypothetical protein [Bacillus nakamurai]MCC9023039.1 hypothetical protein [Bacillus nakamurai]
MNLYVVTALVISVFLNIVLCIQLGKLRANSHTNAQWRERMGLNNPFGALVWAFLAIIIILALIGLLAGVSDL